MRTRVVVLGAGFGGLELTTILSEAFGDEFDLAFIDEGDAFVFGAQERVPAMSSSDRTWSGGLTWTF